MTAQYALLVKNCLRNLGFRAFLAFVVTAASTSAVSSDVQNMPDTSQQPSNLMSAGSKEKSSQPIRIIEPVPASEFVSFGSASAAPERGEDIAVRRLNSASSVSALGENAFGESASASTGSLSFSHTDITLPGRGPSIGIVRTFDVESHRSMWWFHQLPFADWKLEIPRIATTGIMNPLTEPAEKAWQIGGSATPNQRCSQFGRPADFQGPGSSLIYSPDDWWSGVQLIVPGSGTQQMLKRAPENTLVPNMRDANGQSIDFPIVTAGHWMITCLPQTSNGVPGEAFLAVSPDGDKYWFDWFVTDRRAIPTYIHAGPIWNESPGLIFSFWKAAAELLVTRVEDRFGNFVTYTYNGPNLTGIQGSDGRSLKINWIHSTYFSYVDSIVEQPTSSTSRTWTYQYHDYSATTGARGLRLVTRPDASTWQFELRALNQTCNWLNPHVEFPEYECPSREYRKYYGHYAGTITSPSGLVGTFTVSQRDYWKNHPAGCQPVYPLDPCELMVTSLSRKTYSGPGVNLAWDYRYRSCDGSSGCVPVSGGHDLTIVDRPDGRHTVQAALNSNTHAQDGVIMRVDEDATLSANSLDFVSSNYVTRFAFESGTAGAYPARIGIAPQGNVNRAQSETLTPLKSRVLSRNGVDFSWNAQTFDSYGNATRITRSSTLGSRTDDITHNYNRERWVLAQVATVKVGSQAVVSNTFDPMTAVLKSESRFGKLHSSFDYHADGSVWKRKDGLDQQTTFDDYKRGIPRSIVYDNADSESIEVDDFGQITSHTAAGYKTDYRYDAMNRLSRIIYPTGDTTSWNDTTRTFERVSTPEYGLTAGHWRLTESTGNARSITYYDALWRPVLARAFDSTDEANTRRMVLKRYDADSRITYESYPERSIASITATPGGTRFEYDGLGRLTKKKADSELLPSVLETRIDYLAGFQQRITDPRGNATTIGFQAFDDPDEAPPTTITGALGVTTTIARDVYGKPETLSRSGNWAGSPISTTRSYAYDAHQRLCRTTEPESGATLYAYDAAGNLDWSATGQPSGAACPGAGTPPIAAALDHTYDTRNRLTRTTFADGAATVAIDRSWTPDGLPQSTSASGTTWTYAYNKRRLLESETLSGSLGSHAIGHAYDANGHARTLTYPGGASIAFDPNAFGEPRQIGSYASGIRYHPNGALERFTYGNAIQHASTLTTRGLPDIVEDAGVLKDDYDWDANGNVLGITDLRPGPAPSRTRSMGYDARDRLTSVTYAAFGSVSYQYDVLDNLRRTTTPGRDHTYLYDATTRRLTQTQTPAGAISLAYAYDSSGNATRRTPYAFTVDRAHRLTQVRDPVTQAVHATYTFDGNGRRVGIDTGSGPRLQLYGLGGQFLYEQAGQSLPLGCAPASDRIFCHGFENGSTSTTASTRYVYLGHRLIARTATSGATSTTTWLHTDGIGSPVAESSASGTVSHRALHEPYGAPANSVTIEGPGYAGHVVDGLTGLSYMQARFYDPIAARFLSVDPVAPGAESFNRYWYANNNPYTFVDPDGRDPKAIAYRQFGAAVAGVLETVDREILTPMGPAGLPEKAVVLPLIAILKGGAAEIKAAQLLKNVAQGANAEKAVIAKLGDEVAGTRVTLESSTTGQRSVADIVTTERTVVEVKSGGAQLSPGQKAVQADIDAGRPVIPRGQNAERAGLEAGKPIELKCYEVDRCL